MNKILLVNESNIEVSNDLPSNSRPAHYRCLIFPCLFLKVGQEKMAHGTDRGAANELSQRAKKGDGRNAYISHFIKLCRQTTVTLCDPPFSWHRIQSKSQQNQQKSPGALHQLLLQPRAFYSPILKTSSDCSRVHLSRKFPLQTSKHIKLMSTWVIGLVQLCLLRIFLPSPLSGLLAKSLTFIESDLSSKLRKLN